MTCLSDTGRWRKPAAMVLMLALLCVSLHVFAHLGDVGKVSQPAISSGPSDHSDQSGSSSLNSGHACLACQSLQHLKLNTTATIVWVVSRVTVTDHRVLHFFVGSSAHSAADRAPPLV